MKKYVILYTLRMQTARVRARALSHFCVDEYMNQHACMYAQIPLYSHEIMRAHVLADMSR